MKLLDMTVSEALEALTTLSQQEPAVISKVQMAVLPVSSRLHMAISSTFDADTLIRAERKRQSKKAGSSLAKEARAAKTRDSLLAKRAKLDEKLAKYGIAPEPATVDGLVDPAPAATVQEKPVASPIKPLTKAEQVSKGKRK